MKARRWVRWACIDTMDNYEIFLSWSRYEAEEERDRWARLRDAKFVVTRVEIREIRKGKGKGRKG